MGNQILLQIAFTMIGICLLIPCILLMVAGIIGWANEEMNKLDSNQVVMVVVAACVAFILGVVIIFGAASVR